MERFSETSASEEIQTPGWDAITAAFTEYSNQKVKKASRPSVLQKLAQFKDTVRDTGEKIKKKVLER